MCSVHPLTPHSSGDVDDILRLGQSRAVPVQFATRVELDRLTDGRPHQNVVLAVSPFAPPVISAPPALSAPPTASTTARPGLWIALAGLLDPQNVGSIIRTAFYYNCVGLVSPLRNTCDFTPIVSKASAGTMEIFDHLYRTKSLSQYIKVSCVALRCPPPHVCVCAQNAKHAGFTILGTGLHVEGRDEKRDSPRRRLNPQTEPIILLLGRDTLSFIPPPN